MTQEELLKIKGGLDEAEESTTPFAIVDDSTLTVVGDANDTAVVMSDYEINFRIPKKDADGKIQYSIQTIEYKDVFITPRMDTKVIKLITKLIPYFRKPKEDGTVGEYTQDELAEIIENMEDEIFDIMYDLVACVLNVDASLVDFMMPDSVLEAVAKIIRTYPSSVNAGDTFFGSSSAKQPRTARR